MNNNIDNISLLSKYSSEMAICAAFSFGYYVFNKISNSNDKNDKKQSNKEKRISYVIEYLKNNQPNIALSDDINIINKEKISQNKQRKIPCQSKRSSIQVS